VPQAPCTGKDAFAQIRTADTCFDLKPSDNQKADTFALEVRDENGDVNGISLNYYGGAASCGDSIYWLTVNVTCDKTVQNITYVNTLSNGCQTLIHYVHESGCPVLVFDKFV